MSETKKGAQDLEPLKMIEHDKTCVCGCDWCNMTDTPCHRCKETQTTLSRLEYLRGEIENERISMMEIMELTGLAEDGLIPDHDLDLLQWAGVPESGPEREYASRNV